METGDRRPEAGDLIDDFTLPDERGEPWRLADQVGRPTMLIFHRHLM